MTRDQLIASLAATDNRAYYLDDDDLLAVGETGRYFDWSEQREDGVLMEVGDSGGDAVQIPMTRDQILTLQQRLTAWLLTNA